MEDIAGRVRVQGRGGTVLQPAVTLLHNAKDFPKDGPILIISSHVVVKTNGDELPDRTFEEAGKLAAYYSQARGQEIAPNIAALN